MKTLRDYETIPDPILEYRLKDYNTLKELTKRIEYLEKNIIKCVESELNYNKYYNKDITRLQKSLNEYNKELILLKNKKKLLLEND